MKHYAGLDVSLKEISICVVDEDGATVACGAWPADPEGVAGWFSNRDLKPRRIVHEIWMLSIWLQRGMTRLGPATEHHHEAHQRPRREPSPRTDNSAPLDIATIREPYLRHKRLAINLPEPRLCLPVVLGVPRR